CMNDLVRDWVEKAEGDYEVAIILQQSPKGKRKIDAICFHTQQTIEKYLKAALTDGNIYCRKTHNLLVLLDLLIPVYPLWESWRTTFRRMNDFAVEFRYPGDWADPDEAKFCVEAASKFRIEARTTLGLSTIE